jgi:putative endonuclease
MSSSSELGKNGENHAVEFLRNQGWTIREVNWRYRHKELDIIAEYAGELHIVEVKTRTSDLWQKSNEVVSIAKQRNMIAAAEAYVVKNELDMNVVFDIVYILHNNGKPELSLIGNAFSVCDF